MQHEQCGQPSAPAGSDARDTAVASTARTARKSDVFEHASSAASSRSADTADPGSAWTAATSAWIASYVRANTTPDLCLPRLTSASTPARALLTGNGGSCASAIGGWPSGSGSGALVKRDCVRGELWVGRRQAETRYYREFVCGGCRRPAPRPLHCCTDDSPAGRLAHLSAPLPLPRGCRRVLRCQAS